MAKLQSRQPAVIKNKEIKDKEVMFEYRSNSFPGIKHALKDSKIYVIGRRSEINMETSGKAFTGYITPPKIPEIAKNRALNGSPLLNIIV